MNILKRIHSLFNPQVKGRLYCCAVVAFVPFFAEVGPDGCTPATSDDVAHKQQEQMLQEANSQAGMPAITNFQEKKLLKSILEMRDQANLITYTYLQANDGQLVYLGQTVGYGIPYSTQYTNPSRVVYDGGAERAVIPQADPNGLFSPTSSEGTWILMKDPHGTDTKPVYIEPRIVVSQFPLPCKTAGAP